MSRPATSPAAVLMVAAALAGCTAGQPAATSVAEEVLRVGLDDYEVRTGADAVAPGALRLEVHNVGGDEHDLRVDAGGVQLGATEVLRRGEQVQLAVDVSADVDELELWCTLPGHRSQGMATTLPVGGSSDAETAPSPARARLIP